MSLRTLHAQCCVRSSLWLQVVMQGMRRVHWGVVRAMGRDPMILFSGRLGCGTVLCGSLKLLSPTKHLAVTHTTTHPQWPWGLTRSFPAAHSWEDSGWGHRVMHGELASQSVPRPTALGTTEKAKLYFTFSVSPKLNMAQLTVSFQGLCCEWQGGWVIK